MNGRNAAWWHDPEQYVDATAIPDALTPYDPDVVRAYADRAATQSGWGAGDYLGNRHRFASKRHDLTRPFAFVMRSIAALCVDIDGKNGGSSPETTTALRALGLADVPTLGERSKSGNGYHLFYGVADEWSDDPNRPGYARFHDRIGLLMGVDIKAVTLVFHHPHQLWNLLDVAEAPGALTDLLTIQQQAQVLAPTAGSPAAMRAGLRALSRLRLPIETGSRNTTLWGLTKDLYRAGFPATEEVVEWAAGQCGVSDDETATILRSARSAVSDELA